MRRVAHGRVARKHRKLTALPLSNLHCKEASIDGLPIVDGLPTTGKDWCAGDACITVASALHDFRRLLDLPVARLVDPECLMTHIHCRYTDGDSLFLDSVQATGGSDE